ncbi:FecR protein domain-containing protein [Candidatus Electronema halotolerans]
MRQYRSKDFAGAVSNLDYAAHLIRQKKTELLKKLLPEPFYGWQAKEAVSQSLGTAVFGGGSTVSRDYFTQNGSVISIEIVSDSPVLQSIIMMLNNPLFAGASGGNLKTIKRQRAMIKYNEEEHSGEINIVVASRFIVTVKGRGIDMTWLLRYAEAMDFDVLAKN